MLNKIIHFSIENKLIIGLLIIALIAWGIYSFKQLPIDAVPDITDNQVQVVTVSPSLAPQEVEQLITYPIEIAMANTQGVENIRSISRYGLSVVTIVFKENIPTLQARQLVSENLLMAQEEIPEALGKPGMMPVTTGLGEIYQYTLDVKKGFESQYTATELRTIQDWIVKRQLAGIPGIVEVSSFGGFVKEYEVSINPELLKAFDISINEVHDALAINNENTGGSYITKGPNAYYIRTEGILKTITDIESVMVKNINGIPVLIKDIAEVKIGHPPRFGAMTKDGKGEAVGGITLMLKGANAAQVTKLVEERIKEVQKSLPEGVVIKPYIDRSVLVGKVMHTVSKNLIEGGLIVIFILLILLGNLRAGLIIASVIPLSMLFAISLMNLFGISANLMSLGAIDFGLIVDGSVIIVEGIIHLLHKNFPNLHVSRKQMDSVVLQATQKIRKSASFGVIIILIVYLPILSLVGIEGKMFKPMALTVGFALIGALILSFTYVPMISSLFLNRKIREKKTLDQSIMNFIHKLYDPTLKYAFKHKLLVISATLLLFIGSIFFLRNMGAEFIPSLEEGDLAMQMTIPPGSSLDESVKTSTLAENILMDNFPEVKSVVSKIGTAEVPTDPMAVEDADIMILLKPKKEWTSAKDREELVNKMKKKLSSIPYASFEFTQPIQLRFNELLTGTKSDITVKIFGEDLNVLFEKANEGASLIQDIQGASDIKVEQIEGFPQLMINYNREKIAHLGLSIQEINRTIRTALAGEKTGIIFEGEKKFDLVVRLHEDFRKDFEPFKDMYIETSLGIKVPISAIAKIEFQEGPMQISRDNANRRISIGINIRNRDVQSLVTEIKQVLDQKLELPAGYYITYGGEFENLQAAKDRGKYAVPLSLILILILLYFAFNSLKQALMIFSAIPLAAIGGILALWLRGMPFSISAGVGFIALFGVAVLNGIVLINYFNQLKSEGIEDIYQRVFQGAGARLRPVLMTAAVASLGFLPMALSTTAGAEVQRPLATVVIGGLISATFLTLVVLPVIYILFEERIKIKKDPKALIVIPFLLFAGVHHLQAQDNSTYEIIDLNQSIDIALKNNPEMANADLMIRQAKVQKKSALEIPKTEMTFQRGQINSVLTDNYYEVVQNLGSPFEYLAKRNFKLEELKYSELNKTVLQNLLTKEVKLLYYKYLYLNQEQDNISKINELYQSVSEIAKLMYRSGESNYLSKLMIESTLDDLKLAQQKNKLEINKVLILYNYYLNTDKMYAPSLFTDSIYTSQALEKEQNSQAKILDQKIQLAEAQNKLKKASTTPGFNIGYFNQELDQIKGFSGFQLGVNIPLFFFNNISEIQSSKINLEIVKNEVAYQKLQINNDIEVLKEEIGNKTSTIDHYKSIALRRAEEIQKNAKQLYEGGEISYIEFIKNMEKAFIIKSNYLKEIYELNKLTIELEYKLK